MNKVTFPNANNNTYHVIYDGSYVWASTAPNNQVPASIIRLNPNDLSYVAYTFPNDTQHMSGCALAVAYDTAGKEHVFIGLGGNTTSPASWLYRFNPSNFPSLNASVNLRYGSYYPTQTRAIVFAGNSFGNNKVYCACDGGWIFSVDIDSMKPTYLCKSPTNHSIFSGTYDGSYIWWGDSAGEVLRMNPTTYSLTTMKLELASGRVHDWAVCPNGYLWTIDYDAGHAYIINATTMEYNILNMTLVDQHAVEYDGTYVWIADNTTERGTPLPIARLSRFKWDVPARKFEQGLTGTFAIDTKSNVNVTVTFDKPFAAAPIVVVSLNLISDNTAVIVNVQAVNVTNTGFVCSCVVSVAGHAGSTAKFSWLATSRYDDIPS